MNTPHSSSSSSLKHMGRIPVEGPWLPNADTLRYGVHRTRDVDAHAQTISQWSQDYDQLSQGPFRGALRELWMDGPRIQLFHEHTEQQTSQRCQPWRGSVWFGIPDQRAMTSALRFCGRPQPNGAHPLLSARKGEEFSLRTPQDFGIYGVVVDEDWLTERSARNQRRDALGPLPPLRSTLMPARLHTALCETIESMLRLGAAGETEQAWGRAALHALLDHLFNLLSGTPQDTDVANQGQAVQRRLQMVMAARDIVVQPYNCRMTVDELCEQLHVTRRTLQNHFQSAVGESPADFLKAVRLNACRRSLRGAPAGTTVQEIAAQWGFFHMGHFSQDYKDMFGELPSHTLRQPH